MVKIEITMDDQGRIGVNGPLQDKILCFGLLELAKAAVHEFGRNKSGLIPAIEIPSELLRRGN